VPVLEDQFSAIPLRNAAKDVLLDWNMELNRDHIIARLGAINGVDYASATEGQKDTWVTDNSDRVQFGKLRSNYSAGDHSASLANIDNTDDKLTPDAISLMKRLAKTASPKIRPIKPRNIGDTGRTSDAYILFAPSLLVRDLSLNSAFTQANREARARGKFSNPLFRGADYIWDNIAIVEIEDIAVVSGVGAGSIDVAPCYLCGAQALGIAWAKRPQSVEETFDYKDKQGVAIRQWYNVAKLNFGSGTGDTDDLKDHGVVTGWFAAVADA
jgi:N4-gp56 family major capsid protein